MRARNRIMLGMAGGALWTMALLWIGGWVITLPVFTLMPVIMTAFLAPGLVLMLMLGRMAARRFFDETLIDGDAPPADHPAAIDLRVISNTVEQLALALAIWPAAAVLLGARGPGMIVTLGLGFAMARLLFWLGYHLAPPLRAFGFAATFYPTVAVALWAIAALIRTAI
ncbi:MAPEG family protein [Roseovarius sp. SCSIO 43702]|uniref:MAPEG family protein n=1 Tax=Roseovarius sp. SCSIO 43702 TaxID=2823043 RepID=UPI001C72D691|nr:MAPEG family protein [Roseovarius sp. SCSIO 43702]QYX55887.1 MAPEG family protein [Roseovarius sp. SCSIO 43702]